MPDAAVTAILNHSCLPDLQLPMRRHNASSGVTSWTPCPLALPRSEDCAAPAAEEGAPAGSISTSPSSSLSSATVCARVLVRCSRTALRGEGSCPLLPSAPLPNLDLSLYLFNVFIYGVVDAQSQEVRSHRRTSKAGSEHHTDTPQVRSAPSPPH